MGSRRWATSGRIPVKLPVAFGSGTYVSAFGFTITNDVAVAMMKQPFLSSKARVWMAVLLACAQDAKKPAICWHGQDPPTGAVEIPIAMVLEATDLSRATVYRALTDLAESGSIRWNLGKAKRAATFAVVLNPPPPVSGRALRCQEAETGYVSPGGTPNVSRQVFKTVPVERSKERQEGERSPNDNQKGATTERTTPHVSWHNALEEDDRVHGRVAVSHNETLDTDLIDLQFGDTEQCAEFVRKLLSA